MTDPSQTRILHARSGVTLEQRNDGFAVVSLRTEAPAVFDDEDQARQAFDAEVARAEKDPELMSRLGGA
ncbi:hypothetical protein SH203_02712 [Brevundimonas sp. SH203]|uniref:hypothetical protein n=1 Tax=Brevundimonas sp. SH203 TaxID=345167 RepID=UPI0009CF497C|nr:hypothetical protein [Brevundimonas sp. SH203]GAW42296.1 hypothetical protein SH203_02712 [Brevundimonas sp. SH203]